MGVTGIKKSYFAVWTAHGLLTEVITFDKDLWDTMKQNLQSFILTFIYHHYLHRMLKLLCHHDQLILILWFVSVTVLSTLKVFYF